MKTLLKKMMLLSLVVVTVSCSKDSATSTPNEVVKTKVKITGFNVTNFSFVAPDGLGWDGINGLPDVYCGVFNGNSTLVAVSTTLNDIAQSQLPINVTLNTAYQVPNFSDTINIVVMDSDQNDTPQTSDDEIGYVPFIMTDYTIGSNKYPSTVTKTANGVTVTLLLTWE